MAPQGTQTKQPARFFALNAGTRLYFFGLVIPAIVWFITQFRFNALSEEMASKLCHSLMFVWLNTCANYAKIVDLGHEIEASAFLILVLMTFIYAAIVVVFVLHDYRRQRDRILDIEGRDIIVSIIMTLFYFVFSTFYQVSKIDGNGLFYVDNDGFWILQYYIMPLWLIFATFPLWAVCAAKLIDMMKRGR